MIDQSTVRGRVVAVAMKLAEERPWGKVTYFDLAEAAGLNLAELRREFVSKADILAALARMADDHVLASAAKPSNTVAARDRLFDVIMSRFDALAPHRSALRSIARSRAAADPALLSPLVASQTWMLRAAGIQTDGVGGAARVAGLAGVYAAVFRVWLDDDDPGMARTMAALDRRLRRGERTLASIEEACGFVGRMASIFTPSRAPAQAAPPERPYQPPEYPDAPPPMA